MLFSAEKWAEAEEIQPYIQASSALSFEKCASAFAHVEEKYIIPVIGEDVFAQVQEIYDDEEEPTPEHLRLLQLLQGAEANLALAEHLDEFQIRLTDQGLQRQETEKFKQAYRYQEKNMQHLYLNRGLNNLDRAIAYLDSHAKTFASWPSTTFCVERKKLLVRSASEIDRLHFINNSSIIYMRLMPSIREISETQLPLIIGRELYAEFMKALTDGSESIIDASEIDTETFRVECSKYIIYAALARLIRETGSITDRGLYFDSQKAVSFNPEDSTPGTRSQIGQQAAALQNSSDAYARALQSLVELHFPQYFGGHDCDVFKRDNRHKRTFFA